jgi:hypothetical protein
MALEPYYSFEFKDVDQIKNVNIVAAGDAKCYGSYYK